MNEDEILQKYEKKGLKLWLFKNGQPFWVRDHLDGASKVLKKKFRKPEDAYEAMFDNGFVRVQLDRYDCFFNFGGKMPNRSQMDWLKTFCLLNEYVLQNADSRREVSLESFLANEGNCRFYQIMQQAKARLG